MYTNTPKSGPRKARKLGVGKNGLLLLLLFALFLIWPHRTRSQTSVAGGVPQSLPQRVIYGEAFKHIVFLDVQADLADQHGEDGSSLRNFYQTRAGLTDEEGALLKSTAQGVVTALQGVDERIRVAITTYRAQFHKRQMACQFPAASAPCRVPDAANSER